MQFNYDGSSLKSGVYKLTNTTNGRIYVGSCKEFKTRWKQHSKSLEMNKHSNRFLLNDFNKCGTDAFVFEILEVTEGTKEERLAREQLYLDQHYDNLLRCYNLRKVAISREGYRSSTPEETQQKCSKAAKDSWADPIQKNKRSMAQKDAQGTEEARKRASEKFLALWATPEHQQAMSECRKRRWASMSEEERAKIKQTLTGGTDPLAHRKTATTRRRKLEARIPSVQQVLDYTGKTTSKSKMFLKANLLSPAGVLYCNIYNLRAFSEEQALDAWKLQQVIEGQRWSYKGWTKCLITTDMSVSGT